MTDEPKAVKAHAPGIRSRLALIVVACIVPMAAMAAFLIIFNYERERGELTHAASERARAIVFALEQDFASKESALAVLSTSEALNANDLGRFHARARKALASIRAENILLLDTSGKMLLNTRRPFGTPLPTLDHPVLLDRILKTGKPGVSDLFANPVVKGNIVALGVPVWRDGTIAFTLNAAITPEQFGPILQQQALPESWRSVILDSSGRIVARSHNIEKYLGQKASASMAEQIAAGGPSNFESTTLEGVRVLTVYSRSERYGWIVALGMPLDELSFGVRQSLIRGIAASVAILALGLLFAWLLGGRISRSMRALLEPAKALGTGELVNIPRVHFKEADAFGQSLVDAATALHQAKHAAHHDSLTGLANRALFNPFVHQQLALCKRTRQQLAVLYIDLDGFKAVNDAYGHMTGDDILRTAAMRIKAACRASDVAARLGGDEFAVCLMHSNLENAQAIANNLIQKISAPYLLGNIHVKTISASIGVADNANAGIEGDALLKAADKAMYQAKALGKGCYVVAG